MTLLWLLLGLGALAGTVWAVRASLRRTRGPLTDADFRRAVDAMQLGVTIRDAEDRILYSNPAEAAMHGYEPQEMIGLPARTLGAPTAR